MSPRPPSLFNSGARLTVVVAALVAILMPAVGPVLDHHFPERVPGHGHALQVDSGMRHMHAYEDRHGHGHAGQPGDLGDGGRAATTVMATHVVVTPHDDPAASGRIDTNWLPREDGRLVAPEMSAWYGAVPGSSRTLEPFVPDDSPPPRA